MNMPSKTIDNMTQLNLDELTLDDFRFKYSTGQDTSTEKGRDKKHSYRHGVQTPIGDVEAKLWCRVMEMLIERAGEQELQTHLREWYKDQQDPMIPYKNSRALQVHSMRIFDDEEWVDYIPFNQKYRPELVKDKKFVRIISQCCGKPGEVTQAQIDKASKGCVCCPHCGYWSEFTLVSEDKCDEL